jgi:hypothetical protein
VTIGSADVPPYGLLGLALIEGQGIRRLDAGFVRFDVGHGVCFLFGGVVDGILIAVDEFRRLAEQEL